MAEEVRIDPNGFVTSEGTVVVSQGYHPAHRLAADALAREQATTGLRFNSGKPRLHLLPWSQLRRLVVPERQAEALQVYLWAWRQPGATLPEVPTERLVDVARVLEFGTRKYAPGNWTFGMAWLICVDCYFRHVCHAGKDAESGLDSLAHADCNLVFLSEYIEKQVGTDDRPRLVPGATVGGKEGAQ